MGFTHDFPWLQPEKFEHIGIAYRQSRFRGFRALLRQCRQLFLVFGQARAFVLQAADLTLQLPDRPVAPNALDLIEKAFGFIRNSNQFGKVTE